MHSSNGKFYIFFSLILAESGSKAAVQVSLVATALMALISMIMW